ncbi:MAG: hypothetical protein ACKVOR_07435 [Flavobacteriales bacterium]
MDNQISEKKADSKQKSHHSAIIEKGEENKNQEVGNEAESG